MGLSPEEWSVVISTAISELYVVFIHRVSDLMMSNFMINIFML